MQKEVEKTSIQEKTIKVEEKKEAEFIYKPISPVASDYTSQLPSTFILVVILAWVYFLIIRWSEQNTSKYQ